MDVTGIGSVFEFGSKFIDKLFPDPAARDAAKFKLLELQQSGELKELELLTTSDRNQTEVNLQDSKSERMLQYGWRPFIGWVCGAALCYQFLARPLLTWAGGPWGIPSAPGLELDSLVTLLTGMLGLAGMRSLDKRRQG